MRALGLIWLIFKLVISQLPLFFTIIFNKIFVFKGFLLVCLGLGFYIYLFVQTSNKFAQTASIKNEELIKLKPPSSLLNSPTFSINILNLNQEKKLWLNLHRSNQTHRDILLNLALISYYQNDLENYQSWVKKLKKIDPNHDLVSDL